MRANFKCLLMSHPKRHVVKSLPSIQQGNAPLFYWESFGCEYLLNKISHFKSTCLWPAQCCSGQVRILRFHGPGFADSDRSLIGFSILPAYNRVSFLAFHITHLPSSEKSHSGTQSFTRYLLLMSHRHLKFNMSPVELITFHVHPLCLYSLQSFVASVHLHASQSLRVHLN